MPTITINARSVEISPGNRELFQMEVDVVDFGNDEDDVVILLEDEVVTDRAEALHWIDSRNENAVREAAVELGILES